MSDKQLDIIEKKILSEELFKRIRSGYQGEKLDDMLKFYEKLLKNPKLSKEQRKQYKRQKRNYKIRKQLSLNDSDNSSLSSSEEFRRAVKMSIEEAKGTRKKNTKKNKTKKRKTKKNKKDKKNKTKKNKKNKTKKKN